MDMNINGGNNTIAPNATKIEQHIHITIDLPCSFIMLFANITASALRWWSVIIKTFINSMLTGL